MHIVPKIQSLCLESVEPQQAYDSWSETWSSSVTGVRTAAKDEKLSADEDGYLILDGSAEAHVLHVEFDDGDSYGVASGKLAVLHVFADLDRAQAALAAYEASPKGGTFAFQDDFGREISMSDPVSDDNVVSIRTSASIDTFPIPTVG